MITTSDNYVLLDGEKLQYAGATIYAVPRLLDDDDLVHIDLRILGADSQYIGGTTLTATYTELTAFTETGSDIPQKFFNLVEQFVKDWLEGIPGNTGATFTIA